MKQKNKEDFTQNTCFKATNYIIRPININISNMKLDHQSQYNSTKKDNSTNTNNKSNFSLEKSKNTQLKKGDFFYKNYFPRQNQGLKSSISSSNYPLSIYNSNIKLLNNSSINKFKKSCSLNHYIHSTSNLYIDKKLKGNSLKPIDKNLKNVKNSSRNIFLLKSNENPNTDALRFFINKKKIDLLSSLKDKSNQQIYKNLFGLAYKKKNLLYKKFKETFFFSSKNKIDKIKLVDTSVPLINEQQYLSCSQKERNVKNFEKLIQYYHLLCNHPNIPNYLIEVTKEFFRKNLIYDDEFFIKENILNFAEYVKKNFHNIDFKLTMKEIIKVGIKYRRIQNDTNLLVKSNIKNEIKKVETEGNTSSNKDTALANNIKNLYNTDINNNLYIINKSNEENLEKSYFLSEPDENFFKIEKNITQNKLSKISSNNFFMKNNFTISKFKIQKNVKNNSNSCSTILDYNNKNYDSPMILDLKIQSKFCNNNNSEQNKIQRITSFKQDNIDKLEKEIDESTSRFNNNNFNVKIDSNRSKRSIKERKADSCTKRLYYDYRKKIYDKNPEMIPKMQNKLLEYVILNFTKERFHTKKELMS